MDDKGLLIKAEDFEGCDLISSLLQDSIFNISLHSYNEEYRCFCFLLNRFCWEDTSDFEKNQCYYRVHSGLYVSNVTSISTNGDLKADTYLNLLALHASENEINMIFSDHKHICFNIDKIQIFLKDLHAKYPTAALPVHDIEQ